MATLEDIEKVELTANEILKAKEEKFYRLKREEWLNDIKTTRQIVKVTAEDYYIAFKKMFPIKEDEEQDYAKIVMKLCAYFASDPRCESGEFSRAKGILLFGGVGVGKSTLMQIFQRNQSYSYRLISCREIENSFAVKGAEAVDEFSHNRPIAINSNPYGHQEIGYCFDDLGTENAVTKHFGNTKNVMADILLNRYDNKLDPRATHITTNLDLIEIEKLYGTRVLDRIAENFNIITFDEKAKSRR